MNNGDSQSQATDTYHFHRSRQYHKDASSVIAGGVNSNVRLGQKPLCFARAHGARLIDVDDNEYIDYALAMGPAILGHAPDSVIENVRDSLSTGQMFAGQHSLELSLAQLLQRYIPSADLVRIGLTGSEMVQAALRAARAFTGRNEFIKFEGHYHGWFDNVLVNHTSPAHDPSGGVPFPVEMQSAGQSEVSTKETNVLPWNHAGILEAFLKEHGSRIAAIITEPVMCNTGVIPPRPDYLKTLRDLCDRHGIVLIFDEVITGFRLDLGGAQKVFGVQPDLSVFAKAFGGGFPVAALVGRSDIMQMFGDGKVNHSGTYNANLVSLSAGIATLRELAAGDGAAYQAIEQAGGRLITGIRDLARQHGVNLRVQGYPSVFNTCFIDGEEIVDCATYQRADAERMRRFITALVERGVRLTNRGTWFVSSAHTDEDVRQTLSIIDAVLKADV